MASNARAFERQIQLAVNHLKPPEFQKVVARQAREILAEHMAGMPTDTQVRTIVDGRVGAREESVRYGGVIRYEFGAIARVVQECLDWLRSEASKVGQKYASAFFVGILKQESAVSRGRRVESFSMEGRKIPASRFGAASRALTGNEQFIIGNERPENRKIDVQLMGFETIRFAIDDMIYDRCALAFKGRFPGFDIRRVYTLQFTGQWILVHGPRAGRPVHSPGLVITRI